MAISQKSDAVRELCLSTKERIAARKARVIWLLQAAVGGLGDLDSAGSAPLRWRASHLLTLSYICLTDL